MNSMDFRTWLVIGLIVVGCLIALVVWFYYQKMQSFRLQARFGAEYNRTVSEMGSRRKAERELRSRERRVERLRITPLSAADATRFLESWKALQARFVDNPKGVVTEADRLVRELMSKRGYPMGDFERRSADISVDHPDVVANYRAAQAIAARDARGEADTEELRRAVVHYRALFDELLEVRESRQSSMAGQHIEVRS